MEELKYKVGDVVLLKKDRPAAHRYGWDRFTMDRWLGQICTVSCIGRDGSNHGYFQIEEDRTHYTYEIELIECLASEELIAQKRAEEEKKLEAFYEKHKDKLLKMEDVLKIAQEIYGEEFVDSKGGIEHWSVTIRFPQFTIENSRGETHEIRDMFFKTDFLMLEDGFASASGTKASITVCGRRSRFSLKEYESRYIHSHLRAGNYVDGNDFCLGSSAFRMLITDLSISLSVDMWTSFFLSIPNYLKWESLEGGPHIRMEQILYRERVGQYELAEELRKLAPGVPKSAWEVNGVLRPIPTSKELFEYFNKHSSIRALCGYDADTIKTRIKAAQSDLKNQYAAHPLIWKGETIAPVVDDEAAIKQSDRIASDVVREYCRLLSTDSKYFLKQKNYNNARHSNYQKVFGEDRIVEQADTDSDKGAQTEDRLLASASW